MELLDERVRKGWEEIKLAYNLKKLEKTAKLNSKKQHLSRVQKRWLAHFNQLVSENEPAILNVRLTFMTVQTKRRSSLYFEGV